VRFVTDGRVVCAERRRTGAEAARIPVQPPSRVGRGAAVWRLGESRASVTRGRSPEAVPVKPVGWHRGGRSRRIQLAALGFIGDSRRLEQTEDAGHERDPHRDADEGYLKQTQLTPPVALPQRFPRRTRSQTAMEN
jgi:hypothetical protein